MNIGKKIKELRKEHNMTANQLADLCNVSQSVISKLENGQRVADVPTLKKICEVFNITLSDFFASEDGFELVDNDLRQLLNRARKLNSKQIKSLTDFLKTITDVHSDE
ncbi:helix-turn-helix domain-containing protein [Anaerosalibacter massiliensis]|uniref:Helix-turn-helix domain-containing protein n=1 Tax=Anaerosalibacter massiliensis TaxID=1347392 RepID=A0A9X2S8Q7_9FIRM|nr:helix-turn-helix domain-containing protein [Anaerosalibacter massiliensis]MCR2045346.1 helix-turn-helix domain-containing protein [Anaerosalibacter massiliensis]